MTIAAPTITTAPTHHTPWTAVRLALLRNGYLPIPCKGKVPEGAEWQRRLQTNEREIGLWERVFPYAENTGCLTRTTPALDVDISDRNVCIVLLRRITERFDRHGAVLCRIGNPPRFCVPFKADAPFRKIISEVISPDGEVMKFEFLGDGQQFIVHGRHPTAGVDYRWWPVDRDPMHLPRHMLPPIDEAGAKALVTDLTNLLLCDFSFTRPQKKPERTFGAGSSNGASYNPRLTKLRLDGLIVTVANATQGVDRNTRLFWAVSRVQDMIASGELDDQAGAFAIECLHEAASRTGLPDREINRTIASAAKTAARTA
jgi:Bifunctional DNA primase/polymerase, N-terminal